MEGDKGTEGGKRPAEESVLIDPPDMNLSWPEFVEFKFFELEF